MNAVISGRAGLALLIEGASLMSLDVNDLETLVPRSLYDLRLLVADATDLITLENTDRNQAAERLDLEHDIACALDMTLIALDPGTSMELRSEAVGALDELLTDPRVIERIEFTMYAKPLPRSADLLSAMELAPTNTAAGSFLDRLSRYQTAIGLIRDSWDALPDHLFGDEPTYKPAFHDAVCREGLFRLFALSDGDHTKIAAFRREALNNKSVACFRGYRDIIQRWCATVLVVRVDTPVIERVYEYAEEATEPTLESRARSKPQRRKLSVASWRKMEIIGAIRKRARRLLEQLGGSQSNSEKAHRETIESVAVFINANLGVTREHVHRVQIYAAGVARVLGCSAAEIEAVRAAALLHNIGKIAVPDYIINKPGKLTAAEFEKMKFHTIAGAQILSRVEFPYPVVPVVRHHHERWDGAGYPDGLSGENIPLTARILTVVDCFDAVREDRVYRKGMTRQEAIDLVLRGSGTQYDPIVVGTFIAHLSEFETEISAHRGTPLPSFIDAIEQHAESGGRVAPAAGLAEDEEAETPMVPDSLRKEMSALCDLAQAVIEARSQGEVITAFTEKVRFVVPYSTCTVTLVDVKTGQNVVAHATGSHWMFLKGRVIETGEGVTGWVLANRKEFCNTDPRLDLPSSVVEQSPGYRTLAVFPIVRGAMIYGAVSFYSSTLTRYTVGHQELIRGAVSLLASALAAHSDKISWGERSLQVDEEQWPRRLQ